MRLSGPPILSGLSSAKKRQDCFPQNKHLAADFLAAFCSELLQHQPSHGILPFMAWHFRVPLKRSHCQGRN